MWHTSPLLRCQETATALGADPAIETALIEMAWGDWEGRRPEELRSDSASGFTAQETRGLGLTPPGGESPRSVAARLRPWLDQLHRDTVAVSHKGVIRALFHLATGWGFMGKPPGKVASGTAQLFERGEGGMLRLVQADQPLAKPWSWPRCAAGSVS
jgi:probable phosphoglycerate mutase